MTKNDSFFEKLGRSLKIEDEQYEASLTYDGAEDDDIDSDDPSDQEAKALEEFESNSNMGEVEELEPDEEMLEELQEEPEGPIATLAVVQPKKSSTKKLKKIMPKPAIKTKDTFEESLEEGRLNIDVYELNDEVVIISAIAGINESDLDIDISPDSVSIRGKRTHGEKISDENYFYKECYWGAFSRMVRLHTEIDPDKADATLENGILTIRLPKLSKTNQKKLKVKKVS